MRPQYVIVSCGMAWAILSGCSAVRGLASKEKPAPQVAQKSNKATQTSTDFGHGEFTTNDKLKNPAKLHLAYAQWQERQGELSEARESYLEVLKKNSKSAEAYLGLSRLDMAAGRIEEAEENISKARKLSSDPNVLLAAGSFYMAQDRWPEAIEVFQTAHQARPDDTQIRFALANALARNNDLRAALSHFKATVGTAEAHYNVGYVLYEQGKWEASEQQFRQAVEEKPQLVEAQEMLAKLDQQRQPDRSSYASREQLPAQTVARSQPAQTLSYQPEPSPAHTQPLTYNAAAQLPAPRSPQNEQWKNQQSFE